MSLENTITADVIVVGAGLAGLKAATDLEAAGRKVVMIEARDRVGGRLKRNELHGHAIDQGAQWIGASHDLLASEGARFGLKTYAQYEEGKSIFVYGGKTKQFRGNIPPLSPLALLELYRLQKRWDREMNTISVDAPWTATNAKRWDSTTVESWIEANLRTSGARALARMVPRSAYGVEPDNASYLWLLDAMRSGHGLEYLMNIKGGALEAKFLGGTHQVAQRMADALKTMPVLGAPVRAATQNERGVSVVTDKGTFEAREAILAIPPSLAANIHFDPLLPPKRDALQKRMPPAHVIKVHAIYERPFWRDAGLSGQVAAEGTTVSLVYDDTPPDGRNGILIAFIEGDHAIEMSEAGDNTRRQHALDCLVSFFGPKAGQPLAYTDNDWATDEWARGYVGFMPPGALTRFGDTLRAPCGRIHWAGTETAREWAGYLEGALVSGRDAARAVLERLR